MFCDGYLRHDFHGRGNGGLATAVCADLTERHSPGASGGQEQGVDPESTLRTEECSRSGFYLQLDKLPVYRA